MPSEDIELRTLIVSALGLSIPIWNIAFNLGVHGTIFYDRLQALWVAATVVLLAVVLTGKRGVIFGRYGTLALLSPTFWFIFNALTPQVDITWYEELVWFIALTMFAVTIPYILYVIFQLIETDAISLPPRYRNYLTTIVIFVALAGLTVGMLNSYFVSCDQFRVAGDAVPADCGEWQNN